MGIDRTTGQLPRDGKEQVRLAFENLVAFLAEAQVTHEDVGRVGVLLADGSLRETVNEYWVAMFPNPASRPARHTTVRELPGEMLVQLEVIAMGAQP